MGGLLDSLSAANSGLAASEYGLEIAGQNLANINTAGYSRRVATFAESPPTSANSAGRGVDIVGAQAVRDQYVQARMWTEEPQGSYQDALVSSLTSLNSAVGLPGAGLDSQLGNFFDSFASLSNDPTSASARSAVVAQGNTLASAFNQMAGQLTEAGKEADATIGGAVAQINQLSTQVAQLNTAIADGGPDVESLRDQRDQAISTLAGIANVNVMSNSDGTQSITLGQGRPLVVGTQAYALTTVPTGPQGYSSIVSNGVDITSEITGGQIGGLLDARDAIIPGYQNQLDQLAYNVATQVNTTHEAGFDAHGNAAGAFFTAPAGVAGAAAALTVSAAIKADSSLVAASSNTTAGDNGTARAISGLRNATIVNGATPTDAWGQLVFSVGSDLANAQSASTTHSQVMQQLQALHDQASGVSMDEEATNLMKFQRSYEASARYFSTVVSTLDVLMAMVQ